jgi:hypothetical protein
MSRIRLTVAVLLPVAALQGHAADHVPVSPVDPATLKCASFADAETREGEDFKRLALLVGVGDYAADHVTDLRGPIHDVADVYHVLTDGEAGYDFPAANVCVLLDSEATLANVRQSWDAMTDATSRGDTVFFFYAGHGSQTVDRNGDESDGMDETLMLHDARTPGVFDLIDDDFNAMVRKLHAREPQQIVLALDSCNSGSAARGESDDVVSRMFVTEHPEDYGVTPSRAMTRETPLDSLPGLVVLSGAKDGSPSLESGGRGFFTQSLTEALGGVSAGPVTWAQIGRQVEPLVSARSSRQLPTMQGALDSVVFNNTARNRPISAEIKTISEAGIELIGTALPGWGVHAGVRVYPGNATAGDVSDPSRSRALLRVTAYHQLTATAVLEEGDLSALRPGDLVVLSERSPYIQRLPLRIDRSLSAAQRTAFESALAAKTALAEVVEITDATDAYALEPSPAGGLQLRGPDGVIRRVFDGSPAVSDVLDNLSQHTRQRTLLRMQGEAGSDFTNNESLQVWISRHDRQLFSCASDTWVQACPGELQQIPLCARWELHVRNTSDKTLLVGGAILWNDGGLLPLPEQGREVRLAPGEQDVLYSDELVTGPPLNAIENIVIAGTSEQDRIDWQALATPGVSSRRPPTRAWTTTHLRFNVIANPQLAPLPERVWQGKGGADVGRSGSCVATREQPELPADAATGLYLAPYLPADPKSPLGRVLSRAHTLALSAVGGDASGAALDSAGAIALAFSGSGVAYPEGASAVEMAAADGPMSTNFASCLEQAVAIGDVLVFEGTDASGEAGYAMMVLDPDKQIGWGAHAFTGAQGVSVMPGVNAVEYARIDASRDWSGIEAVSLAACWRHNDFIGSDHTGGNFSLPPCWERTDECCAIPENCEGW